MNNKSLFSLLLYFTRKRILFSLIIIVSSWSIITFALYAVQYIPKETVYYYQFKRNQNNTALAHQYLRLFISETSKSSMHKIRILQKYIHSHPDNYYNSNYLSMIGDLFLGVDATLQAAYYYTQSITKSAYNISPHFTQKTLSILSKIEYNTSRRIQYNKMLLEMYPNIENKAEIYYTLGTLYDSKAAWDDAYQSYEKMLAFSSDNVPSTIKNEIEPIFFRVQRKHNRTRQVWNTVYEAKQAVQRALYSRNTNRIRSYQSPFFFTAHWQESIIDTNTFIPTFNLVPVLLGSNIRFDDNFSPYSTNNKVLWKTRGWERVGVWYMVFMQITQPDTPQLNGKWEWAGIYFGEGNSVYVPQ